MLTDVACRKAKPNPDGKERKLPDSLGLLLAVTGRGYKVWRFKYRFAGKEKKLVIGPYPEVGLSEARKRAAIVWSRGGARNHRPDAGPYTGRRRTDLQPLSLHAAAPGAGPCLGGYPARRLLGFGPGDSEAIMEATMAWLEGKALL